ncbi:MAG: DUF4412 domain-containing protein [Desulfobacterales bacterium]|nr:DUF4412 domain-containing protein [Deltaproteobacteria bacterium]NNK93173.1 DUF4412 domain-containing protein [Desulfobacterales bacterium]
MHRFYSLAICLLLITCSSAGAVEFSADIISEINGPITGKMYYKSTDTYRSDTMGMINIVNGPLAYMIVPDTKKYTVTDFEELSEKSPMGAVGDVMEMIKKNNMKKIGKEKIQGYSCVIYEGTVHFSDDQLPMGMKLWYSKKLKNTLKQEVTLPASAGKMISYIENIKLAKQDDSLFEIPQGYTEIDTMVEAMGMGEMQMLAIDVKKGEMPSAEDRFSQHPYEQARAEHWNDNPSGNH